MISVKNNFIQGNQSLVKRFKTKVFQEGVMEDVKKHSYYMKPSLKKILKRKYARQQRQKDDSKLLKQLLQEYYNE